ncbi:hypothetical protein [Listeria booriae]|nr:hypothetical protein [Listeria booriae]MBC2392009.1 hypothetical protein [Listeria booriae]
MSSTNVENPVKELTDDKGNVVVRIIGEINVEALTRAMYNIPQKSNKDM